VPWFAVRSDATGTAERPIANLPPAALAMSTLRLPLQTFDANDHTVWPVGVVNVIARPSGTAPPRFHCVDNGKVGVGALSCAHPNFDDDIVHRPGMIRGRDISNCLVVERRTADKAAVEPGGDRRPGGRADFRHGRVTARRAGGNQDTEAKQAGNHGRDPHRRQSLLRSCDTILPRCGAQGVMRRFTHAKQQTPRPSEVRFMIFDRHVMAGQHATA